MAKSAKGLQSNTLLRCPEPKLRPSKVC